MFSQRCRLQRSALPRHPLVFLLGFTLLLLAPVMESMAQGLPIQARPTPTPTEVFDPPIAAEPTEEPPRPTEDLPLQAQPTAVQTEEPPVVIEEPSTLTINKGACDDSSFDAYNTEGLDAFQAACASPDGEFEFTVSNGDGFSETSVTSLGTVQFVVPTGAITITETIPVGFGDPAVFCWSNLLAAISGEPFIGNGPQWEVAEGEQVECWWFNVSADVNPGHSIRVTKHVCPEGVEPADDYWTLSIDCADPLPGIDFTLTNDSGVATAATDAAGEIEWTDVDLGESGQIQIGEDVPDGYGEPIVWCVSFPVIAADAQDFDFVQLEAVDGVIAASPEQHEPFIFSCAFFNIPEAGVPDDLADPGSVDDGNVVVIFKQDCPADVVVPNNYEYYVEKCDEVQDSVEFTLDYASGSETAILENGELEWTWVPIGPIEIQESIPPGYGDPIVFCRDGPTGVPIGVDSVPSEDGLVSLDIPEDSWRIACAYFNIAEDGVLDDMTTTDAQEGSSGNTVTVIKHRCPMGVVEDASPFDYMEICTAEHDDIGFVLDHEGGSFPGATASGQMQWTGVPPGDFQIQETLAAGYLDPLVFCNFTELPDGALPLPELVPAAGGLVSGSFENEGSEYVCWWFNIPDPDSNNSLTIHAFACPAGVPYVNDNDFYKANCPESHPEVEFTLTAPHGVLPESTGDDGMVEWAGIPLGDFSIQETIPDGYGEPVVLCNFADVIQGIGFQNGPLSRVQAPGGLISAPIEEPNVEYRCSWFNIPADGSSLVIDKWLCPEGFDKETDSPGGACTEVSDGVTFTAQDDDPASPDLMATTGDVNSGSAVFEGLPPGAYSVTETLPEGIAYGFFTGCQRNGEDAALPVAEPDRLDLLIGEHEYWECRWYNVPEKGNAVSIRKLECVEGTSPDEIQDWYEGNCTETIDGVEFTLTSDAGEEAGETGGGVVDFAGLPAGGIEIRETIPDGFGNPIVFCRTDGDWIPYLAPAGNINHQFPGLGETLFCHWFNIPGQIGDAEIIIYKWTCPFGYDETAPGADPHEDCTEATDGVTFTIADDNPATAGVIVVTGDSNPGQAQVDGLAPGDYVITETLPDGFVRGFHYGVDGDADPLAYHILVGENQQWHLHWFNVPEDNSIVIHKWRCPEGATQDHLQFWLVNTCTEPMDDVEFRLTSDLGIAVLETVDGTVVFDGLPPGTIGIQETIPDGFGAPVVYCNFIGNWKRYDAPTGYITEDIPAGDDTNHSCGWYNLPSQPGDVTILKWTCPEGYDLFAEGADPALDCTEATNGIDFQFGLSGLEEEAELQTTGEVIDGGVFFDDLEPDTYKAVELVPEGSETVFVLECTGHLMGVLQPYPLQMGNVLEIEVGAGEHLVCHWFNVPGVDPELGQITVYKYVCSTETFVSEVDCEIYEDGQAFDLLHWNVDDGVWEVVDTGVTDGFGKLGWPNLPPGDYGLDEVGDEWCHLDTMPVFGAGDFFSVSANEETVVNVYNCTGEPGKPGDTPTEYPNTGVPGGRNEP